MWDQSHWNTRYKTQSLTFDLSPRDYMFRQRDELYKRIMPRGEGRTILEVGCAPGDWMVYFYWELGLRPTGIDFAPDGAEAARRKLRHFGVPGEVICADFLEHDFGEKHFDVVFFQGSLEHFPEPEVPLGRALSLLSQGGMVLAQIPCYDRYHLNYYLSLWLGQSALAEHYMRSAADMASAFRRVGMHDVKVEPFGTFEVVLEPDRDLGAMQRMGLRAISGLSRLIMPVLSRLDIHRQSTFFSPHLLAYATAPASA